MQASAATIQSASDDEVIDRILTAVGEIEGCDPLELPPIYDSVEPDALGQVVRGAGLIEVSFSYHGYRVTVEDDRHVRVTPE